VRSFWLDVRYGLRMLGKNPGFTAIAILTLSLGIGANTAIFSIFNQILLKRLPVKEPNRLVMLKSPGPKRGHVWSDGDDAEIFSYPLYKGIAKNRSAFSGVFARYEFGTSVASNGETDHGSGELVSGNYFETLGVQPALGRLLTPADDVTQGAHPVVVLSHGYWTRRFASDPGILNQVILVNNTQLTVIGVAQAGFTGIQVGQSPDLFVPMMMKPQMTPIRNGLDDWNDSYLAVFARLKPGLSKAQAEAAINVEYKSLMEQNVATLPNLAGKGREAFLNKKLVLADGSQGRMVIQRDSGPAFAALFAMVILVLLIACTNVANLLMAKGSARQREFAIRSAMGASRGRMIWQLQIESLVCALAGGLLGLILASWLMNFLVRQIVSDTGIMGLQSNLDGTVLAFAVAATLGSALLFGLFPAWRVARTALSQTLKDQGTTISSGPTHVRFRKFLVAGQVAFTLLLLVGAALFTRTLWNLRSEKLGLSTENVMAFSVAPQLNGYDTAHAVRLADGLRERIAGLPGVRGVGSSEIAVLTGTDMGGNITIEGRRPLPDDEQHVDFDAISPNYFSTLGVPLLSGREFRENDNANSSKVCIISESMVKAFFPNRNPLGVHLAIGGGNGVTPNIEIVGVVKDMRQDHVRSAPHTFIYFPYSQAKSLMGMTYYVRTQQEPLLQAATLRGVVREMDANLPVFDLKTLQRVVDEDLFAERIIAGLSATFGGLAALLAAVGIYGVLAYLVLQRTREIGIRIALGAAAGKVRALVYREVAIMIVIGAIVGLPAAFGLARLGESLLFGVKAANLMIYAVSLGIICVVAAAACYIPSRRATRIDPIVALRYE
jgi:predicted permease